MAANTCNGEGTVPRDWIFCRSHWLHVSNLCLHPCLSDSKYSAFPHDWVLAGAVFLCQLEYVLLQATGACTGQKSVLAQLNACVRGTLNLSNSRYLALPKPPKKPLPPPAPHIWTQDAQETSAGTSRMLTESSGSEGDWVSPVTRRSQPPPAHLVLCSFQHTEAAWPLQRPLGFDSPSAERFLRPRVLFGK